MMNSKPFVDGLLAFLTDSPTPWHATANIAAIMGGAGFEQLKESDEWELKTGGRYFITRNESSIIAFVYGKSDLFNRGIKMVGAHTDSPCLKIKPNPETQNAGLDQLAVEPYGGVLLNPWFDRDLSVAGRVSFKEPDGTIGSSLVDFKRAIAIIPSLAIHLDREANKDRTVNAQTDLPPIISVVDSDQETNFRALLLEETKQGSTSEVITEILEYEMNLYDVQPAALTGLNKDFVTSARLDNLLSCWVAVNAIKEATDDHTSLIVCTDHEEVGSASACGAQGPFLRSVLERLSGGATNFTRIMDHSVMISADNAHALHPNYKNKHDPDHAPLLNGGPVLKVNSNQRYATNSETAALFKSLCADADVPMQVMVARSDMGCGSTIGPITASEIGVPTVDVGIPQLAMHSIRETACAQDVYQMYKVIGKFFDKRVLLKR